MGLQGVMIVKRYWHGLSGTIFLSALDEQGCWFRYHPLLQETLRTILQQNNDINLKHLHELASHWFVEQRLWSEAVRHALAAGKPIHNPGQDGAGAQSLAEEGDIDTTVSGCITYLRVLTLRALTCKSIWHGRWRIISASMNRGSCLIILTKWSLITVMI